MDNYGWVAAVGRVVKSRGKLLVRGWYAMVIAKCERFVADAIGFSFRAGFTKNYERLCFEIVVK